MDLNKLSRSERIIAVSGIALFVISFFPWFGKFGGSHNGWDNILSLLAILLGIVMVAQVAISRFTSTQLPTLPVTWGQVHLIAGVVALAFVVLQFLIGDEVGAAGFTVDLDRKVGIYLGIIASAGLAAGGFLRSQEPETATRP